jgi:hypothetical protein
MGTRTRTRTTVTASSRPRKGEGSRSRSGTGTARQGPWQASFRPAPRRPSRTDHDALQRSSAHRPVYSTTAIPRVVQRIRPTVTVTATAAAAAHVSARWRHPTGLARALSRSTGTHGLARSRSPPIWCSCASCLTSSTAVPNVPAVSTDDVAPYARPPDSRPGYDVPAEGTPTAAATREPERETYGRRTRA